MARICPKGITGAEVFLNLLLVYLIDCPEGSSNPGLGSHCSLRDSKRRKQYNPCTSHYRR